MKLKKFFKGLSLVTGVLACFVLTFCEVTASYLPDSYKVTSTCSANIKNYLNISADESATIRPVLKENDLQTYDAKVLFMNMIPIKK